MNVISIETPAATGSKWSQRLCLVALSGTLCLLALLAYLPSFSGAFVYDDGLCIVENEAIDEWWPQNGKLTTGSRRWLTHFTLVANYKLHGFNVFGYHVVNLAIHAAGGCLLFGLVRRSLLLPGTRERYEHSATALAWGIAALWLVHPLQTEAVTYIVQRLEALAGMFFLLTLYALLRGSQTRRSWPWYLLMLVAVYLGFGAKETMFLAPLVVLAFDRIFLAHSWRELIRLRGGVYLAMLPAIAWAAYMLKFSFTAGSATSMGFGFKGVSPWEYLRSQPAVILHYLKLTFWPSEQCLDYAWLVEHDPWRIYAYGAVIVGLLALTLAALWYRPRWGFLGLAFFVILAPTSSFMPIRDLAFEHRMYLPLAAVVVLTVLACHELCRRLLKQRWSRVAIPATLIGSAVIALAFCTAQRNKLYHDPIQMWQDVVDRAPHNERAHYNLGKALANRVLAGSATRYAYLCLYDAAALGKEMPTVGKLAFTDEMRAAIACLERSLEVAPGQQSANFNIGGLYDRAGQHALAIEFYQRELANNPPHLHARLNLARLLAKQDLPDAALQQARAAVRLYPQDARAHVQLGILLSQTGRPQEALKSLRQALDLNPNLVSAKYRQALAQWDLGEQRQAIAGLRELRRGQRQLYDVNLSLARCIATTTETDLRHPEEGVTIAQQVIDQQGAALAEAWETLALCLASMQRYDDAMVKLERAIELAQANEETAKFAELRELHKQWQSLTATHDSL